MNFRGNWGGGEIGELCFANGETEFTEWEINFAHIREKGENEGKLFHKNSLQGNLCETGGGNEREMKGKFVFTTSFNCTVLYITNFSSYHRIITKSTKVSQIARSLKSHYILCQASVQGVFCHIITQIMHILTVHVLHRQSDFST